MVKHPRGRNCTNITAFEIEIWDGNINTKFTCCLITIRQCLNKSPNPDIRNLFKITSHKNILYDSFSSTKDALKNIRNQKELTMRNLEVQGAVVKDLWETALPSAREYWFKAQQTFPCNIYNYTIRYMNNSLASLSNLSRCGKSLTSSCNFCHQIQITKHVLSGCTPCLDRYTWRHNSILLNIANILKSLVKTIYVDLPGRFLCPDSITGASHRPCCKQTTLTIESYYLELIVF